MPPVSRLVLSAALMEDKFMFEGVYHSETSSEEIRGMFLQNQEANLAQSIQGSWPTFLANVEPCSNLTSMFANAED